MEKLDHLQIVFLLQIISLIRISWIGPCMVILKRNRVAILSKIQQINMDIKRIKQGVHESAMERAKFSACHVRGSDIRLLANKNSFHKINPERSPGYSALRRAGTPS